MLVRMNVATNWAGAVLKAGDETEVETETAQRWIRRGIATHLPGAEPDEAPTTVDLSKLTVAQLQRVADGRGIDHEGLKKADLLERLGAPANEEDE